MIFFYINYFFCNFRWCKIFLKVKMNYSWFHIIIFSNFRQAMVHIYPMVSLENIKLNILKLDLVTKTLLLPIGLFIFSVHIYSNPLLNMIFVARKNHVSQKSCYASLLLKNFHTMIKSCYARLIYKEDVHKKNHSMENHALWKMMLDEEFLYLFI